MKHSRLICFAVVLQILLGGIRFVDFHALAALADFGFKAQLPPSAQYLLDSPLKVSLLQLLGADRPLSIAAIFSLLSVLPGLAVLCAEPTARAPLLLVLALSVFPKVIFENIGVGDSVTLAAIIIACLCRPWAGIMAAAALGCLWHPQQIGIVGCFASVYLFLRNDGSDRKRALYVCLGLAVGATGVALLRLSVVPPHQGRLEWALEGLPARALRLAGYSPVVLGSLVVPAFIIASCHAGRRLSRQHVFAIVAVVASILVAGATTDVSRILAILTSPFLLLWTDELFRDGSFERITADPRLCFALACCAGLVPLLSWSGVDIYVWPALLEKIGQYR